jgi:ketosteroid isomerase-like protein
MKGLLLQRKWLMVKLLGLTLLIASGCENKERNVMSEVDKGEIAGIVIEMEKAALERWGNGDPDGFLEIVAEDYTYFDPFMDKRVDGYEGIKEVYDALRGLVDYDRFELIDPKVQVDGNIAVLTFNFKSFGKLKDGTTGQRSHWHTTEVFQKINEEWKLISTHWSFTNSALKKLSKEGAFEEEGE